MKKKPKQLIIIGGGTSIQEGVRKGLWKKLDGKFTFGLNFSYRYFPNPTAQLYVDDDFYNKQKDKWDYLPLIIGKWYRFNKKTFLPQTICLPAISKYHRDVKDGVYKSNLVGIFALTLGIHLLDEGEIYLLGYDYGAKGQDEKGRPKTHFYQGDIKHRGIGKVNYYDTKNRATMDFSVYQAENKVKIYNVSPISNIPDSIFPQLTYDEFFKKLDNKKFSQDNLREEIKEKLKDAEKK